MAWNNSRIFRPFLADVLGNAAAFALATDTFRASLWDNDNTPDNDVTSANSAYGAGQWVATGNEVTSPGEWDAGGVALASLSINSGTADVVFWDAADAASSAGATITNAYGVMVYDDTLATPVADQGVCYNYLGGANSVVNGTFTVVWHANGIFRITL